MAQHPTRRNLIFGILLLTPAAAAIIATTLLPALSNLLIAFQDWNGFAAAKWIGFDNFKAAFADDYFWKSMKASFFIGIISTLGAVPLGVLLAACVFKVGKFEGSAYRVVLFVPVMIPLAIIGLLFTFMLNPEMGLINKILELIGLENLQRAWLSNPDTVMWVISLIGAWRMAGLTMMLTFATMISIPTELFESSKLDGAGYPRQFFSIMLPLIRPSLQVSTVFSFIVLVSTYDLVYIMTRGGPGTVSQTVPIYMMKTAFTYSNFGSSATIGLLFSVAGILVIFLLQRLFKGENHEI
ncbi:carbohydrate ABC transporter permease [Cohnella mopanensis]|uniref:carbohydrate ABC transporter permease n=1 Tax=Cohnella mopanensis TaxID=2911966 RepID=UPI001EF76E91|nr:sugar ABC transporter permease [Cohnella mopanensis]